MKRLRPVVLAASMIMFVIVFVNIPACDSGAVPQPVASVPNIPVCDYGVVPQPAAIPAANENLTTFRGTVTSVEPGNFDHPYLRWVVTLSVDKVDSGPPPGKGFWFAIHSPSQEGVKVGQRYRIMVTKKGDGYELFSRDLVP